jgi:outer membrane protein, multidrug efflux system
MAISTPRFFTRVGMLGVVAWLTACSHTTDSAPSRLDIEVPAQWGSAAAASMGPAPAAAAAQADPAPPSPDLATWWQQWGDAQLSELIERALQANTSVLSARAALEQARAANDVQRAGLWPGLNASTGARRSQQGLADASNSYSVGVDASWELDIWGQRRNTIDASWANYLASQENLYAAHVSLAAEVALQYIQLRSLQQRLEIAERNLALQAETEQMTRWRVQAGLAAALDGEQARQALAQTSAQIPALRSSLVQTQHALAVLTGQTPQAMQALAVAPMPQPPQTLALALPADTLRQRPDVRAQEQRVQAALATLSAQERANFPALRLSGTLGVSALTVGALTNGASVARSLAASLAAPLFDAGTNRAQISAQKAALEQARQAWRASVLTALQEVEDALVQLRGDQERLLHLRTAADAAANAQLLAQQRYDSGLVDFRTVLDSQRTLLSSQDSLASAQAALHNDHIRLFKALGGGWQALPGAVQDASRPSTTTVSTTND